MSLGCWSAKGCGGSASRSGRNDVVLFWFFRKFRKRPPRNIGTAGGCGLHGWGGLLLVARDSFMMRGTFIAILLGTALEATAQTKRCTSNANYVFPQRNWQRVQPAQAN